MCSTADTRRTTPHTRTYIHTYIHTHASTKLKKNNYKHPETHEGPRGFGRSRSTHRPKLAPRAIYNLAPPKNTSTPKIRPPSPFGRRPRDFSPHSLVRVKTRFTVPGKSAYSCNKFFLKKSFRSQLLPIIGVCI